MCNVYCNVIYGVSSYAVCVLIAVSGIASLLSEEELVSDQLNIEYCGLRHFVS